MIKTVNNLFTINVRQTGYYFPFFLPSYNKKEGKKGKEVTKPVLI